MKAVILAGGFGTRLSERTDLIPKPMVEIGGRPILWHIMKIYAQYGISEFVVALGYKGHVVKEYFLNYKNIETDCTVDLGSGEIALFPSSNSNREDWRVTLVDTGRNVMTGGRIKRLQEIVGGDPFLLTYGDGLADIDINALIQFHKRQGKKATLTAVHPKAHYGELEVIEGQVSKFMEKPEFKSSWINGGFMLLDPSVLELIEGDDTVFEREPLERLSKLGELVAYRHDGFWQCMDTLRDVHYLNSLWDANNAPWRVW